MADLRKMDISLRELSASFHVPKEIIVLERTLLLLMASAPSSTPRSTDDRDPAYLERFVLGDEGDWSQLLMQTSKNLVMSVTALPADIRKFMRAAHSGEPQLKFRNLEAPAELMYRLGHQFIYAFVGIAGASLAVVLETHDDPRAIWG